jgi:phage baseplate assembly protein V
MSLSRSTSASIDETDRTLGDIARLGTVASLDSATARVTVQIGDALTGPIPWLTRADAAGLSIWAPPGVGEQVLLICPEGEIAAAVALPGIYSNANPAPASDAAFSLHTADGLLVRYDPLSAALDITLPAGGTFSLTAPGGAHIIGDLAITGDLAVTGKIDATGDIKSAGISLQTHKHGGVSAGAALTGLPL